MGNLTKNQQKREIMKANVEQAKQSTLDDLSFQFKIIKKNKENKPSKKITINRILVATKEDELELKIEFSLQPAKASFSKINLDLYFQDQLLNSTPLRIAQSSLMGDCLEYPHFLDMKGIKAGSYLIRVEMYEP